MIGFHRGPLYENYVNRHLSVAPATGKPAVFHFLDQLQKVHPAPFDEHILLIHNTVAREDSIRAAESVLRDCTWVTCPLSNIFIHRAMADLPLLMSMGVRIAVGGVQMHPQPLPPDSPPDSPDLGMSQRSRSPWQGLRSRLLRAGQASRSRTHRRRGLREHAAHKGKHLEKAALRYLNRLNSTHYVHDTFS